MRRLYSMIRQSGERFAEKDHAAQNRQSTINSI